MEHLVLLVLQEHQLVPPQMSLLDVSVVMYYLMDTVLHVLEIQLHVQLPSTLQLVLLVIS